MSNRSGLEMFLLVNGTRPSNTSSNSKSPEWVAKVKLGFNVVFLVVGVLSNLLVIFFNFKIKKTRGKALAYEYFISNLCVSDMVFALMYFVDVYYKGTLTLSYCKIVPPFLTMVLIVSMYTVAAIALFRCRAIVNPFKPKPTPKCINLTIAGIWAVALVEVIPFAIVLDAENGKAGCAEIWSSDTLNKIYTIALFVLQYFLPLTILAVSYIKIVIFLKQHSIPQTGLSRDTSSQMTNRRKRDMEVLKISVIIVMFYAILTLPLQIAWIANIFDYPKLYAVVSKFSNNLLLLHSCCNPFVYGSISCEFRSHVINVVRNIPGCKLKRNNPIEPVVTQEGRVNIALQEP